MEALIQARAAITSAVAEDTKYRVPGVTKGLYSIADIAGVKTQRLPNGIPSIGRAPEAYRGRIETLGPRCADDAEFKDRLREDCPDLADFDFGTHGIVLAGGAVSAIFLRGDKEARLGAYSDFDCFLVGHKTDDAARAAVDALAGHLGAEWGRMDVYRTVNCVTFVAGQGGYRPVQVILRRYSTCAEVIHGFDIGACAFLWDGESLSMTAMGKFAAVYGANILNLQARRVSYENRIGRYFDRGFDLVLPQLDVIALAETKGRLPYMMVQIDVYSTKKIKEFSSQVMAHGLVSTRPGWNDYGRKIVDAAKTETAAAGKAECAAGCESMFEQSDYAQFAIAYGRPDLVDEHNICAVAGRAVYAESLCAIAQWARDLNLFEIQPTASRDMVVEIIRKAGGDLKKLRRLVGPDHAAALALDYLSGGGYGFSPALLEEVAGALEDRFRAVAKIPIRFMTVDDKTALVGPFNRRVLTAAEWYGPALVGGLFTAPQ
jgi:hypothetical protein